MQARGPQLFLALTPEAFVPWVTRAVVSIVTICACPELTARIASALVNVFAAARAREALLAVAYATDKASPILAAVEALTAVACEPGRASTSVAALPCFRELCMRLTEVTDDVSGVEAGAPVLTRLGVAVIKIIARCAFPAFIAVTSAVQARSMPALLPTTECHVAFHIAS